MVRAVKELCDPASAAARWLSGRYSHVLIDEFQDTDALQLDLLELLARDATLFAVGDEAQSITAFAAAATASSHKPNAALACTASP